VVQFYLALALAFVCLSCGTTATQSPRSSSSEIGGPDLVAVRYPVDFWNADSVARTAPPSGNNTVSVNFGNELKLKASYLEKQEPGTAAPGTLQEGAVRRYLNLFGTSSLGGMGFIGEGELTYSPLDPLQDQCVCNDWPRMLRLGVKNRWGGLEYGGDYRSIDRGFVSITGAVADLERNEGQLWGERSLGPVRIRGSLGESWEKLWDTNGLRVTRSATASFNFKRSQWGGVFASTYGLVDHRPGLNQETRFLTNSLMGSYRPFSFLSLSPNFSIKEEWQQTTGVRTETPRTELMIAYAPFRDTFKLSGGTSFAQSFSADGLSNVRTFGTNAVMDWKLGKFFGSNDSLSFHLNYNQQLNPVVSSNPQSDVSGMLQLKVTGF
jgi:hypothetical protein